MISLHNIRTVARYEAKTLRRSWLFRLFSIGALFILSMMNIGLFSPIGDEQWEFLSIPSSLPQMNLYLLNIAQALIIVFLASDFLKKDKKLDTNEVLYTRPMSNLEYIIGKSWGILKLFLGLNLIILLLTLIINIIAKNTFIDIGAYFTHLLIITIPTLIFSLGCAYIMMSVIRNQAITFLLLLGYAALDMFYLYHRGGSIFDYMLFGMPVLKSQITGYDNIMLIVSHRLLYTSLGLFFIFLTTLIFKRLPQSRIHRIVTVALLLLLLGTSAYTGYFFYNEYNTNTKMRSSTLETNRIYEDKPFLTVTDATIELTHSDKEISARADLTCVNNSGEEIGDYYFSLNPSLTVSNIIVDGNDAGFSVDNHIVIITSGNLTAPGEKISIIFNYSGGINEAYSYPWYDGNIKDNPYRIGPMQIKKRQSFLRSDYALLTSEVHWYPVAGLNYYPTNPARIKIDFTNYTLKVKTDRSLMALSQGYASQEGDFTLFRNTTPLTGLTLIIGNYMSDTLIVDSVEYRAYYYKGHDFFKSDLNEIGDTLSHLVSNVMTELVTNFSSEYPFKNLDLVEVPIHFHSIERKNTQTRAEVQPSLILLPERLATLNGGDFYRTIKRNKKRMERNNQVVTDRELQVRAFSSFVRNNFISSNSFSFRDGNQTKVPGRYLMGPSFYFFKNNFYSHSYPVINTAFESHLQKVASTGNMGRFFLGGLSENDKANTILRETSLKDLLATDPSNDTLRIVLTVKGDYIFNLLRAEAGIDEFNEWFVDYLEMNKFKNISIDDLSNDLEEKFGFNMLPVLDNWFRGTGQPGFYFTEIEAREIIVDNHTRYLVSFIASNPEPTQGLFNVMFRTGGRGGSMGGGGMGGGSVNISMSGGGRGSISITGAGGRGMQPNQIDRIVKMDSNQARKISVILDAQPRMMSINTLTSLNNPGEIAIPFIDIIKDNRATANENDLILTSIPRFTEDNEIIVDNEDPGFRVYEQQSSGRLKEWLGITGDDRDNYREMFSRWAPEYWQKTIQSSYYGKYIKSAVYTRAGTGDRHISWSAKIDEPGYYDIYTYITVRGRGRSGGQGQGGGQSMNSFRESNTMQDLHFLVSHDDGNEEVTVDAANAEHGWNHLGSYYLSPDSAAVTLSNLSDGRTVRGDAIKWVKQNSIK
ncbi:MAG: hypothetical protein K8R35_10080 [Bacteroidales bacterium]|nr:hypothetical protein [Bacteroidales bacterium]